MKILYISPQNTVGTLSLWQKVHESRGNRCDFITFFPSPLGFDNGICLNLPLASGRRFFEPLRGWFYRRTRGPLGEEAPRPGKPPIWEPGSRIEPLFFAFRDWLWRFKIEPAIRKYGLLDYDVYHFEWGQDLYRSGDFIRRVAALGKPMLATYHGQDFRNRGVLPEVDSRVWLSLTSEYDLIPRHPKLKYLYLPYDVAAHEPRKTVGDPVTICHATRNRFVKGSDAIIDACRALEKSHGIRFLLVENRPHSEVMAAKAESDIYVDQVADLAPGFGMNSIEAMALGVACCTSMDEAYQAFMPDHPFVNVTAENLLEQLTALVEDKALLADYAAKARKWAEDHHDLSAAGNQLYGYYRELGVSV
ncbi:MAG: hypothetical protein IIA59_02390 [Candidatus Marinimicrobia bacterium]|nr:hypothetical protein [Candidatus Neomarinimicrobiota bacterium]